MTPIIQTNRMQRVTRSPRHSFYIHSRPWQIQTFMIAPVLPGETLKKLTMQSRTVTDPIKNSIMGWWNEHYFFYVKLRDLYQRDLITKMLLEPEADITGLDNPTSAVDYHVNGAATPAINWPWLCTKRVVEEYFRNEGETAAGYTIGSCYAASVSLENAINSLTSADTFEQVTGVDENLVSTSAGQGDGTSGVWTSEVAAAMQRYEYARMMRVTDMTFEDWCEQFGIRMPKEELMRPELIRYGRDWQYPSNTINPENGAPTSAVSWSTSLSADKDRFFKEPGFIVGISVVRPKVYFANLTQNMSWLMKNALAWLPAMQMHDPVSSFQRVAAGDGPLGNAAEAYYLDVKDYLLYGDEFVNFAKTSPPTGVMKPNAVVLPSTDCVNRYYPASTDADELFVDETAGQSGVKQDGVVQLHILGRQVDTSPMSVGTNITV